MYSILFKYRQHHVCLRQNPPPLENRHHHHQIGTQLSPQLQALGSPHHVSNSELFLEYLQRPTNQSFDPLFRLGSLDNLTPVLVLLVEVTQQIGVSRFIFRAFDVTDLAPIFRTFTILCIHFDRLSPLYAMELQLQR